MNNFDNIYLTGDKHAAFDELIMQTKRYKFSDRDLLIILGDAGINYYGDWRDRVNKGILSNVQGTILFVRGNHEHVGTESGMWNDYFAPDRKSYFAFRHGQSSILRLK